MSGVVGVRRLGLFILFEVEVFVSFFFFSRVSGVIEGF